VCDFPQVVREEGEAASRCTGISCPAQLLRKITHFASRGAMDIDGLGPAAAQSLIDAGLIATAADLYTLAPEQLSQLERMGEKSAHNLVDAIARSKANDLWRLLYAFGIRHVGQKASKLLSRKFGSLQALMLAGEDALSNIRDIGSVTARSLMVFLSDEQTVSLISALEKAGVNMESREREGEDRRFEGKVFVLTGTLSGFTRDQATTIIEGFGGKTSSGVSNKSDYVLAGDEAGSKLDKARALGISVIDEATFNEMIQ